jgi:hypothetical protein
MAVNLISLKARTSLDSFGLEVLKGLQRITGTRVTDARLLSPSINLLFSAVPID